ncbi:MAG TPA: transposase [Polyangiaceae bacterium]
MAFRVLAGGEHPHFTTVNKFRLAHREALAGGQAIYARRKVIAEPVFGQIKQAMGFTRFSLRGLPKAAGEWAIVCLCHNLLELRRALGPLPLGAVTA